MQSEIITIGDEILIGHTIDTNSAWMGQRLNELGVEVVQIRSISDKREAIIDALNQVDPQTKLVLITGGLGPTKDDLTKHTLSEYFQTELVFDETVFENIQDIFRQIGRNISHLNRDQALVPAAADVLSNKMGTAAGMRFKKNDTYFISMPGVPYEMKHIMTTHVLPWIEKDLITANIFHKTILTQGIPESELAVRIADFEDALPPEIKLAYLPSPGIVKLRLTARGQAAELLQQVLERHVKELTALLGDAVFGEDAKSLQEVVGGLLLAQNATVATAESCTGGFIASQITLVPGCSRYFLGSVVAYDNRIKTQLLNVPHETLAQHGAVSEPVVRAMAEGVRALYGVDYAIATSGIAGPDGGTATKPVGTTWIAVATPAGVFAQQFSFGANRERNIKRAALMALDLLRKQLLKAKNA